LALNSVLLVIISLLIISSAFSPLYFKEVSGGTFPGINGKIAFRAGFSDIAIWTMNPDGSDRKQLTNTLTDNNPDFSADGKKIVFDSRRDGNTEIYIMDSDGLVETRVTNNGAMDFGPSFSPDGSKIAFSSDRDGDQEIYTINIDGTGLMKLTDNSATSDKNPQWSPDGTQIVFQSNRDQAFEEEIYVMNAADGSGQMNISNRIGTVLDRINDINPSWSPDGNKIVWAGDINDQREIWTMNPDGSDQRQITDDPTRVEETNPSFSPEGDKIVFCSIENRGNFQIVVMNPDGTDRTTISAIPSAFDCAPDWGAGMTIVGGEILPIEATSLILAGAQSFSWMIPVIVSVLGIGLFVFRRT